MIETTWGCCSGNEHRLLPIHSKGTFPIGLLSNYFLKGGQ